MDFDPLSSDVHCGITLTRKVTEMCHMDSRRVMEDDVNNGTPGKWMKSKAQEYVNKINLDCISNMIADARSNMTVADLNSNLTQVLVDPALEVFPRRKCRKYIKQSNETSTPGYDVQCWYSRQQYHKAKHKYNSNRTVCNYNDMLSKNNGYKNNLSRVKLNEKEAIVRQLRDTKKNDPRFYWQVLRGHKDHDIQIPVERFLEYFKSLSANEEIGQPALPTNFEDTEGNNTVLDAPITDLETKKCIANLNNNTSAGIDHVITSARRV